MDGREPARPVAFRSKVDLWLLALVVGSLGMGTVASIVALREESSEGWIALVAMIGAIALVVLVSVPTRYVLTDRDLIVRSGRFRTTIPLASIERVYRTHNPLSAPAWSLDRLGIDYRTGRARRLALISPVRQPEFLAALQQRVPLDAVGPALVRRAGSAASR